MAIKIELKPHIAKKRHPVGGGFVEREVDFGQCYVMVDGKQVGWYCGRADEPGKFLSFIEYHPPDVQKMLAEEVAKITGGVGKVASVPKEEHDV
jgi:hypothetical protein